MRKQQNTDGNLSVVSKTPLIGVTCFGSEMTVAISCFLYYFVLLANLSKNEVPNSQFTMHNSQWKSSLKRAVQSEREIQPLKTGVSLSRLRVQRYDDFSDSANVSAKKWETFLFFTDYADSLARVPIIIFIGLTSASPRWSCLAEAHIEDLKPPFQN